MPVRVDCDDDRNAKDEQSIEPRRAPMNEGGRISIAKPMPRRAIGASQRMLNVKPAVQADRSASAAVYPSTLKGVYPPTFSPFELDAAATKTRSITAAHAARPGAIKARVDRTAFDAPIEERFSR